MPPLDEQILTKLDLSQSILSAAAQDDLRSIIRSRQEAFVADDGRIGCYNGAITHRIDLVPGSKPTQQRPYRTPLTLRDEVQRQVEDMLRQRIIRPSTSPFCSPIVMVKKADGKSWRFAVDYRALNNITQKQTSYLPLIQDILDSDFTKSPSNQNTPSAPPSPPSSDSSSSCAPATFQRVMESMRRELTAAFFIYLDDVVLASLTEEEHLHDIDQFLYVIIRHTMKLRLDKCAFGRAEIKYLGFLISEHGIRPDPNSVESVKAMKPPKTLTELRSFIGAVSYFRRFIANFASIMQPLYALTKKESFSDWKEEHQKAFDTVIEKLVSAPVLAPPRLGRSFTIETDASSTAVAACLLQENPQGEIHPIAYASRLLNKHEARYPSVESEALALVFALREYAPYIEGSGTTVIRTDNSALPALLKKRDLAGRLAKYQMTIQSFDVTIVHRSGKSNTFCDHLSRYPNPSISIVTRAQERQSPGILHHPSFGSLSTERLRTEQQQATKFRDLYDAIRHQRYPANTEEATLVHRIEKDYTIRNGLLCYTPAESDDAPRILVPYTLREAIIGYFHQPPLEGAHLGTDKTIQRIRARFYWPGMTEDIQAVISSCLQCQQRKTPPKLISTEPLGRFPVPRFPFDRVHADMMGPLQLTSRGNRSIMVIVDSFTKWAIAEPLPDQTAPTVADRFLTRVAAVHGVPTTIVTDQGRQLVGKVFRSLTDLLGCEHVTTTPYHQQANGLAERFNQTLASMLAAYVNTQGDDWCLYVNLVTFAYNTAVHKSTGQSPFFLLYGRDARLPLDVVLSIDPANVYTSPNAYIHEVGSALRRAWETTAATLASAQTAHKDFADEHRHAREHNIRVFDLVLRYLDAPPPGQNHKFRPRWTGPFRVLDIQRPNATIRRLDEEARPVTVHLDKLKPYRGPATLPLRACDFENDNHHDDRRDRDPTSTSHDVDLIDLASDSDEDAATPLPPVDRYAENPTPPTTTPATRKSPRTRRQIVRFGTETIYD